MYIFNINLIKDISNYNIILLIIIILNYFVCSLNALY